MTMAMHYSIVVSMSLFAKRSIRGHYFLNQSHSIHSSAISGFTIGGSDTYNKGRSEYPKESIAKVGHIIENQILMSRMVESFISGDQLRNSDFPQTTTTTTISTGIIGGSDLLSILELGSGTGKFTLPFVRHCRKSSKLLKNAAYTATEPSQFIEALKSVVPPDDAMINVNYGTGEKIPALDASCNAIIAAQAFHWMATPKTLLEIHRVLKRNMPLILLWNTYDYEKAQWLKQLDDEILQPAYDAAETPRQQTYKWRESFNHDSTAPLFSKLQYWHHSFAHTGNFEIVFDRILSTSVIAMKSPSEQKLVREHISNILNTHPQLESERSKGVISIPYVTEISYAFSQNSG